MNFVKQHRRLVAVLVTLTFCALLQVSTRPLVAHPATLSKASEADTPRVIEEESDGGTKMKKKSILPIILGVVGVGAIVAAVLLLKKSSYDITGTWNFNLTATNTTKTWTWVLRFSGSKSSGAANEINPGNFFPAAATGNYTVKDKTVTIVFNLFDPRDLIFNGQFDSKDTMSGTATLVDLLIGGVSVTRANWTATRANGPASIPAATMDAGATKADR